MKKIKLYTLLLLSVASSTTVGMAEMDEILLERQRTSDEYTRPEARHYSAISRPEDYTSDYGSGGGSQRTSPTAQESVISAPTPGADSSSLIINVAGNSYLPENTGDEAAVARVAREQRSDRFESLQGYTDHDDFIDRISRNRARRQKTTRDLEATNGPLGISSEGITRSDSTPFEKLTGSTPEEVDKKLERNRALREKMTRELDAQIKALEEQLKIFQE